MKKMIYRQGDIVLKTINEIPKNVKKKNLILAYGEATGHMHQFLDANLVTVYELNQQQFVEGFQESNLVHNEDGTLQIPQGIYEVVQQREKDLTEEIRQVID